MSEENSDAAQWRRIEELAKQCSATDKGVALVNQRLADLERRQDRHRETVLQARRAAAREHRREMDKLAEIKQSMDQLQGALIFGRWIVRISAFVGALWLALKAGDWQALVKLFSGVAK